MASPKPANFIWGGSDQAIGSSHYNPGPVLYKFAANVPLIILTAAFAGNGTAATQCASSIPDSGFLFRMACVLGTYLALPLHFAPRGFLGRNPGQGTACKSRKDVIMQCDAHALLNAMFQRLEFEGFTSKTGVTSKPRPTGCLATWEISNHIICVTVVVF